MKKYGLLIGALCCGYLLPQQAQPDVLRVINQSSSDTNAVLIFLDDSEQEEIDPITSGFFAAFIQEVAPIIVSASLINNIRSTKLLEEKDVRTLIDKLNVIIPKAEKTSVEKQLLKSSIVSSINFDQDSIDKWIIKKINDSLYLFVPKKYLQEKNIPVQDVQAFLPQGPITGTEHALGLKVNHLATVSVTDITEPTTAPRFASYFIDALSSIFVARSEYPSQASLPGLSVFIYGHGMINKAIVGLSLEQFKVFLLFLEKLPTRLLVYRSCYAAGLNTNIIYKDASAGAAATYSFAIIVMALTDAPTKAITATIARDKEGNLRPYIEEDYDCFVRAIISPDIIDYSKATQCMRPVFFEENIPQIRYPGLPWFSVLDYDTVAPIGGIMAKTRTTPLNIVTFYAKQGKPAAPYAILLYAREIPFELLIDTKRPKEEGGTCYVPLFVSMIPVSIAHFINKISSSCNTAGNIMTSFYIKGLGFRKLFIIDEITAPFSASMSTALRHRAGTPGTLLNVLIDLNGKKYLKYFTYQDKVYISYGYEEEISDDQPDDQSHDSSVPMLATDEQEKEYRALLAKYNKTTVVKKFASTHAEHLTPETVAAIQAVQEKKIASVEKPVPSSVAIPDSVVQQAVSMPVTQPTRTMRHRRRVSSCESKNKKECRYKRRRRR